MQNYDSDIVEDFKNKIEEYTKDRLRPYLPNVESGKYIHDTVWGTTFYEPWEVALIDSPLLQRLRSIHQTGLAFLVYPTALHTRFDHTLGVISIVDRIVDSVNRNNPLEPLIGSEDRVTLRLAALLHDVGHGPFSHVSEDVYKNLPEFQEIKKWINMKLGVTPKAHEILSYLIVSSEEFKNWFNENIRKNNKIMPVGLSKVLDLSKIAGYIVGYSADSEKKYLADIINGPIDVDKLDYLARDAKFSGLAIGYDVNRYFTTVNIDRIKSEFKETVRLVVPIPGVSALEQMIISKIMLFSSLYHHQKVRCSEAMFKRLCKLALEGGLLKKGFLKIDHPTDFLKYVDSDFLDFSSVSSSFKKGKPRELARQLSQRKLMKRALIISRPFIEGIEEHENVKASFKKLLNDCQNEEMKLRSKIVKEANKIRKKESGRVPKIDVNHLIIDVPQKVEMKESLDTIVPFDTGTGGITKVDIDDVFPIRKWAEGYNAVKWRIHIFCYPKCQYSVNKASRKVLLDPPYNILLAKTATSLCKIDYSMLEEETQRKLVLDYE